MQAQQKQYRVHQYIGWFVDGERFESLDEALAYRVNNGARMLKARLFVDDAATGKTLAFDLDANALIHDPTETFEA